MIIRPARVDDAEALTTLINAVIDTTTITFTNQRNSVQTVRDDLTARGPAFLVADLGGVAVG